MPQHSRLANDERSRFTPSMYEWNEDEILIHTCKAANEAKSFQVKIETPLIHSHTPSAGKYALVMLIIKHLVWNSLFSPLGISVENWRKNFLENLI